MARESLQAIGERYGSDKFTVHRFGPVYERYFEPIRDRPLRLLEIGIGGEGHSPGGESLLTWQEYFPEATIVGIDIHDKSHVVGERIRTEVCDQSDQSALREVWSRHGGFDIIIDDGSHRSHDVLLSLFGLLNLMGEGGIYVIEDTQTGYWPHYGGTSVRQDYRETSTTWLKLFIDCVNRTEILWRDHPAVRSGFAISEAHFHRNIALVVKGDVAPSNVLTPEVRDQWLRDDLAAAGIDGALAHDLSEAGFREKLLRLVRALRQADLL